LQASLHADELPGMLVSHHLIKMLDAAAASDHILKEIVLVPYANPIGLAQGFMDQHLGRFSFETMINFNRNWFDLTAQVARTVLPRLSVDSAEHNVRVIREVLLTSLDEVSVLREEDVMKKELFRLAVVADVALDLHCDFRALMHLYTHDKCWPAMQDLSTELQSHAQLLASISGGNCFDEACSTVWELLAEQFPAFPIPMACQSATVELRGQHDVSDEMALTDARALFRFLQGRGFIAAESTLGRSGDSTTPPLRLLNDATQLTAVDTMLVKVAGVVVFKVALGDCVTTGQLIGEIVNIEDVDAPRTLLYARIDGIVLAMSSRQLCRPGQSIMKVAGKEVLAWRKGNLCAL
jgi:uncharacterized protein